MAILKFVLLFICVFLFYICLHIFAAEPDDSEGDLTKIRVSLLERNRNPHISSHLPLTPSSVFFSGIVGDIEKNNRAKSLDRTEVNFVRVLLAIP